MSTHKKADIICIIGIIATVIICVLFMNGRKLGITTVVDEDAETYAGNEYFTTNDLNVPGTDNVCSITLYGTNGKISGNGAYFLDGDMVISGGGKYLISGELSDGSIIVDAYNSSKVWLILDGVTINCSDSAAVYVKQAEKVFMTLNDGTVNTLASGEEYCDEAKDDGAKGTVFTHDDMTINGNGSLIITSEYKHGIESNDSLHIAGGDISINSASDAIHVNDEVNICNASVNINAGDDGIHSDKIINVISGTILINECYEGLEAPVIYMEDGDVTVYPADDGFNANGGSGDGFGFGPMGGGSGKMPGNSGDSDSGSEEETNSKEASDKKTKNDVADADTEKKSDKTEDSGESEKTYIRIDGGNVTIVNSVSRDADGLDSNGDIYIGGGTIRISMTGDGNNSALDYGSESGGVLVITDGEVIACGSSSMAEEFSDESTQCCALVNLDETVAAGETLSVCDADGNVLMSYDVPCSFNSVNLSSPDFAENGSYVVKAGEVEEEIVFDSISISNGSSGFGGFGGFPGGKGQKHDGEGSEGTTAGEESDEDRPEPPEGMDFDGERPEMPEGMDFDGERPEMPDGMGFDGERPEPPEGMDFDGERPEMPEGMDFDGERPERPESSDDEGNSADDKPNEFPGGGMPVGFSERFPDNGDGGQSDSGQITSHATSVTELDVDTWIWLGAAGVVLVAGVLFAACYKRRR